MVRYLLKSSKKSSTKNKIVSGGYKFVIIKALKRKTPKNNEVYNVDIFHRRQEILDDIDSDIQLFKDIQKRLKDLKLVENDPKQEEIIKK